MRRRPELFAPGTEERLLLAVQDGAALVIWAHRGPGLPPVAGAELAFESGDLVARRERAETARLLALDRRWPNRPDSSG